MKTVLVNFEVFFKPEDEHYDIIMSRIPNDCTVVIGLLLADGLLYKSKQFFDMYQRIKTAHPSRQFELLTGMCGNNSTIEFDFNLNETYLSYQAVPVQQWNPTADKFLFMGGVPNRENRIVLLDKFYQAGLLEQAEWSFFKPWTDEQATWCRTALSHYTDAEYETFLNTCERKLDDVYADSKEYGTAPEKQTFEWCKDPAWVDPAIYNNTVLSVVSEGLPQDLSLNTAFMTEKMWRVFAQQHPFILSGTKDMMAYIKRLGFKTFEQYMRIPNYVEDLDAIVENTRGFLEDYPKHEQQIKADCSYNYYHFHSLGRMNRGHLLWLRDYYNIDQGSIDYWFNQKGFAHLL
jgi:hypothetical protein